MRLLLNLVREMGFDPVRLIATLRGLPRFIYDLTKYRHKREYGKFRIAPITREANEPSGSANGHYFWQDLICAKWIAEANPKKHLDIGSRIDGFIAHLLAFREVTILDIRKLPFEIPGLRSIVGDAQSNLQEFSTQFDSVSTLHSVEHFGLGRYGDPINASGHISGILNIAECVKVGGSLYISAPIGQPKVEFNSQRILHPNLIPQILTNFKITKFVLIPWRGNPNFNLRPEDVPLDGSGSAGLYAFERLI